MLPNLVLIPDNFQDKQNIYGRGHGSIEKWLKHFELFIADYVKLTSG